MNRTLFDPSTRERTRARIRALRPGAKPRWGKMSAPQMVAHLTDQMRHSLGLSPVEVQGGPMRWAWVRWALIYVVPWPRGRVQGPPEAFVTQPASWPDDVEELLSLVDRFAAQGPDAAWPDHALFGPMTGRDWGFFAHKHFDHHLRQFGV